MAITKVTNDLVAVNAIHGTLIADNAITAVHIAQNQVTAVQIADGSITSTQLGANSVDTAELISGSIDAIHLASDSVITAKILDANVTTAKIANNAITSALIPDGSITDTQLGSGAFTMGNITTTGSIRGPASLTIDPATVGDNTGTVVIAGNLQVDGTTTTVNSTTLSVADKNITIASGAADAAAANDAGLTVTGASATLLYKSSGDKWSFNKPLDITGDLTIPSKIMHTGDLDNYFRFSDTDTQVFVTGNSTRLQITNSLIRLNQENNNQDFAVYSTGSDYMLYVDASTDRVGIGTASPGAPLHVIGSALVGVNDFGSYDKDDANLLISNGNAGASILLYDDSTAYHSALVNYNSSVMTMALNTANTTNSPHTASAINIIPTGVGIGETTPLGTLHVKSADSGASVNANANELVIEGSGSSGISILSGTSGDGNLFFGDSGGSVQGKVAYSHNGDYLSILSTGASLFYNGGSERMRIDSSGNVGIGNSSYGSSLGQLRIINDAASAPASLSLFGYNNISDDAEFAKIDFASQISGTGGNPTAKISANIEGTNERAAHLTFHTHNDGGSLQERMRIDSDGNIGIGTTSPNSYSGYAALTINGTSGGLLDFETDGTFVGEVYANGTSGLGMQAIGSRTIVFRTNSGDRMTIDSSGKVGIACADPANDFNVRVGTNLRFGLWGDGTHVCVQGANDANSAQTPMRWDASRYFFNGGDIGIGITSPSNTLDIGSATANRGISWGGSSYNYNNIWTEYGSGDMYIASGLKPKSTNTGFYSSYGGASFGRTYINLECYGDDGTIKFGTSAAQTVAKDDAITVPERMRISSTGDVGINVTNPVHRLEVKATKANYASSVLNVDTGSGPTNYGMHINLINDPNDGTRYLWNGQSGNSTKAQIMSNGSYQSATNSYGSTSDEKLKENIKDASNKLDEVLQLKVRNFNYKADSDKQKLIGMIAQEVETVFPALVFESEDTETVDGEIKSLGTKTKSLKYSVFVPILIKAIQEQQTTIEDLKSRIETLEG